jgi:two-component system NtrC family sensor kinase
MRKLFTPFFTTKREVKGVGLGLAVSYGIIQRHRGRIEVQSKEGEGTTFTVYLPLRHEEG